MKTEQSLNWLTNYYREFPIGGGWEVQEIAVDDYELSIHVRIPDQTAAGILEYDIPRQWRILSVACPNIYEEIWNLIDENHIVEIEFSSPRLGAFSRIDCLRTLIRIENGQVRFNNQFNRPASRALGQATALLAH